MYPNTQKCAGMETTGSGDSWGDKMNKPMLSNTLNKSKKEGKEGGREERRDRIPGSQKCLQTKWGRENQDTKHKYCINSLLKKISSIRKSTQNTYETATTALQNLQKLRNYSSTELSCTYWQILNTQRKHEATMIYPKSILPMLCISKRNHHDHCDQCGATNRNKCTE